MEADFGKGLALNRFLSGEGKADVPLDTLYLIWRTTEVRELFLWICGYNLNPAHRHKISYFGFDAQSADGALGYVTEYLARVEPMPPPELELTSPLRTQPGASGEETSARYRQLPEEVRAKVRSALSSLLTWLDAHQAAYVARTSAREWALAHRAVVVAQQAERLATTAVSESFRVRDTAMAEHVRWIADAAAPDSRVVLWAHNVHITHPLGTPTLGARFRDGPSNGFTSLRTRAAMDSVGAWHPRGWAHFLG